MDEEVEHAVDDESQTSNAASVLNVIPIHLDGPYEELQLSTSRGKYYKQTYRSAWEQMPDFKGWLRGVEGEPTRAYCTYCQKTLHAHRLSLLKHTCTIKHQKAAQLHSMRKNKGQMPNVQNNVVVNAEDVQHDQGDSNEADESILGYQEESIGLDEADCENLQENELDHSVEEEEEEDVQIDDVRQVQFEKDFEQVFQVGTAKPPVSTHVIDTSRGWPVAGLQVSLYKLIDGRWTYINEGITNQSGRFSKFLESSSFTTGRYKLHYDVDRYFDSRKQESIYPFIEIVFDLREKNQSFHVPLLLSPYGYTTYRG